MAKDLLAEIHDAFDSIRVAVSAEKATALAQKKSYSPTVAQWITGSDTLPALANRIDRPMAQHGVVFRAMDANAKAVARFPLRVYPTGDRDLEVADHWLSNLWVRPDPLRRANQLTYALSIFLDHWGEWLLVHDDVRRGGVANAFERPHQLLLLDPRTYLEDTKAGELIGWVWMSPTGRRYLSLEQVTFCRMENPYDPIRGLGPLQSAMIEVSTDYQAALWNRSFLTNGSIPPVVFSVANPDHVWSEEDRRIFIAEHQARRANPGHRGEAMALPPGVTAQLLKTTMQEMEFNVGRTFSREQILMILSTPPAIAGVPTAGAGNYQNFGQQRTQHHFGMALPRKELIESAITVDLLQRYEPDREVVLDDSKISAEVTAEQYQQKVDLAKKMWDMGVPLAEINRQIELGIHTDPYPWLEQGWLPWSVTRADVMGFPTLDPTGDTQTVPSTTNPADDSGAASFRTKAEGDVEKVRAARWRNHERAMSALERKYIGDYRKFLLWYRDKMLASLPGGKAVKRDAAPGDEEAARKAASQTEGTIRLSIKSGWDSLLAELEGMPAFDSSNPAVRALLMEREVSIAGATKTLADRMRATLAEGVDAGESVSQLADRIRSLIAEQYRGQATVIARNETAAAYSRARTEGMKQTGMSEGEWLTARDSRVRASHVQCDGQVRKLGDPFPNGLTEPHQAGAPEEETIQCRCVLIPRVA